MTNPVVTIDLTADGVQEVSARIRTAKDQAEAAKLMQEIAPALEKFDQAVRKQLDASMRAEPKDAKAAQQQKQNGTPVPEMERTENE